MKFRAIGKQLSIYEYSFFAKGFIYILLLFHCNALAAQSLTIKNDLVSRTFHFDGSAWRTTQFARMDRNESLKVKSDEFHIMFMNGQSVTVNDYSVKEKPIRIQNGDTSILLIQYDRRAKHTYPADAPDHIEIKYSTKNGEPYIRKIICLDFNQAATVDRLEVERFTTEAKATGGGRGEPVFLDNKWFVGIEYPGSYSRHTNGNTPIAYSRHYELVGNYSYIDLDGKDVEPLQVKGMVRLMHFPGYAVINDSKQYQITSKIAVAGIGNINELAETAFMNYLKTVYKTPRSFLHYNNWFEPKAKDLKGNALITIFSAFKKAISPYNIKMDAMVADDGWQDRESIWQPSPDYFPNGIADVKVLSDKLRAEGTGLGLWLSIGGTNAGVDWGEKHGYLPAKPNKYFSQYFKYYSLSHPKYKQEILSQVPKLAKEAGLLYYKHDFNQLSDLNDHAGHPPTDRHGHEANLDVMIAVLKATRRVSPEIYQNITNWIWFSPWWLMYADALWMLAGDDGLNGNWPEISSRAMGTTDRDTYIWRMWGNAEDRPLVPISRLMTHGIIRNTTGRMEDKKDSMQDWLEHVLMHYGRGTLLKEWYISPEVMSSDHWKALCTVHNWAAKNEQCLNNTVFVGGRPDEGNAYGYIGWNENQAVLVARNPQAKPQKLIIPFDQSVRFNGEKGIFFQANVVFPYQDAWSKTFISGQPIEIMLEGYATMAFELSEGKVTSSISLPLPPHSVNTDSTITVTIPEDAGYRSDLLIIAYDELPTIKINGAYLTPTRISESAINKFAGYAIAGMPSNTAKSWKMASYDIKEYAGKTIKITHPNIPESTEIHLLMERTVKAPPLKEVNDVIWAITNASRRQTVQLR